ncbi:MAG: glycosyl hydrolase family 8 [Pirellulales bacterium]
MQRLVRIGVAALILVTIESVPAIAADDVGAYATGRYRNLFVEAGHTQAESRAKIDRAFQQLFYGDPKNEAVYFAAGENANGPLSQIRDIGSGDVRSEGISYGMMIAVQLDKRSEFDALWNWAKTYMYHDDPKSPSYGYFSWSLKSDGTPNDEMPAPDGEEYFATALYFAANRWGSREGIYNYRAEADQLLKHMRHRQQITGPTVKGEMTAGNLFHPKLKLVRFTPDVANWEHTDPSYHLPAFYELWALWGPEEDRAFWQETAAASRNFFQTAAHPKTSLTPEYANFDGTPWLAPWNPRSADFHADAWRTAMNWSVDWAWWAKDSREQELSDRLQAFFALQGIDKYVNFYSLDGKPLGADRSTGHVAMNAVASLAATDPRSREFVEALWNAQIPSGQWRYYDGMLYLMALVHAGGEFRIWKPDGKP